MSKALKAIIQIPCLNEAETLATALNELPRELPGIDIVEWLIIDDGSTDTTIEIARANGVNHIVKHPQNKGLAKAYMSGLKACLDNGADVIVNTDADNQYDASCIPDLVAPIVNGEADMVVGARPISSIDHFSPIKKLLQKLGSWVVRVASGTNVPDAPSGFRAISRSTAMQLNVFSEYTYTLETIIQAGRKGMVVKSVPVGVNEDLRPSRLVKSIRSYVQRSIFTIFRIFAVYQPFRFFGSIALVLLGCGGLLGLRFLYYFLTGDGGGHVQSVILSAVLLLSGAFTLLVAFLADLLAANRLLLERLQYRVETLADDLKRDEG